MCVLLANYVDLLQSKLSKSPQPFLDTTLQPLPFVIPGCALLQYLSTVNGLIAKTILTVGKSLLYGI